MIFFSELDLEDLAEKLRPYTTTTTRIEMAPWAKAYTVPMQDIYTELTLEKIENQPTGPEGERLGNYKELFQDKTEQSALETKKKPPKKVLMKGDPGSGKTTVSKKISWDWAMGLFKVLNLVLYVSLKMVKPGDSIENIIIQQNPALEGLGIKQRTLRSILDQFSHRCLLILDGMDECDLKKNKEILNIIEGRKLLYCNILVTSRPHSAAETEQYFNTVVQVQGFSEQQATGYLSKVLDAKHESASVMKFYYANFQKSYSKFASPMLLLFICILVNADEIDLEQKHVTLGEIYVRLVRSLYRKFTLRMDRTFDHGDFVKALNNLGKLAWDTLKSKIYHLQQTDILREIGQDAFEYGLLIGHEDFNLVGHEMANVFVTFLHSSIQEFLGSFYFILMLNEGNIIEQLLGSSCTSPIFLMNPLVFYFCLYFLSEKQIYFTLQKKKSYGFMTKLISEKINSFQVEINDLTNIYPSLYTDNQQRIDEELGFKILADTLECCYKITEVIFMGDYLSRSELAHYCPMSNLRSIILVDRYIPVIGQFSSLTEHPPNDEFSVVSNIHNEGSICWRIVCPEARIHPCI